MKFYSGFSLSNDRQLFEAYIKDSEFNVCGFSYGAIQAFEYVLHAKTRIDTLQLFSPAFFQDKSEKFKRTQMMYMHKDKEAYLDNFLHACFSPVQIDASVRLQKGSAEELSDLLNYEWRAEELKSLTDRGVNIEVYLGSEDKIIDPHKTKAFFLPYASVYTINHAGHTLQNKDR